jgi:predicted component of type VI protein secretion system
LISKKHCGLLVRNQQVFLKDFGSTNGTFLNAKPVKTEMELHDKDQIQVGPLAFRVCLEVQPPVDQPTPLPPIKAPATSAHDDEAAALLLALGDDGGASPNRPLDQDGVPTGSTVMDTLAVPPPPEESPKEGAVQGPHKPEKAKAANSADTSTAAKAILDKYLRRPRT